jgi:hypothetical protein
MGLFDKLFGRTGNNHNNNFTPTTELMADDEFWKLIRLTYDNSKGDFETQQEELTKELKKLSPQDIILFDNKFRQLRGLAYNWELWGAIYIIHGGCSDDSFMDFRDWVIAQGQEFYYKTLANPESLVDVDQDKIDIDWEGMGYISNTVFNDMTGQDLPNGFKANQEITGKEWQEEGEDLKTMFPKLSEKYSDNI